MTDLSLRALTKRFGTVTALDDVSLDIPDGGFVCLLGPSGCGKTTLLRVIAGLEAPSAGQILLDGADLTATPVHRRDFGMVFQSLALFPHLNVAENVAYPLAIRGMGKMARAARAAELLELVQLPGLGQRRIHQLSGGQRQRVAIARGLAINPRIFLLDEPLSALDANLREHMQVELRQLQQRLGVTTILVTHDQKEALTMADIVIVMDHGRVQQVGPPLEVYHDPANAFVAGFIGTSNLLPCTFLGRDGVQIGALRLRLGPDDRVRVPAGAAAVLAIRPEDVAIIPDAGQGDLAARIEFIRDLGESVQVSLRSDGKEILAQMAPRDRPALALGQEVGLVLAAGKRLVLAP